LGQTINYQVGPNVIIEWGQAGLSKSIDFHLSEINEIWQTMRLYQAVAKLADKRWHKCSEKQEPLNP